MTNRPGKYTPDQPIVPGADVIYRPAGEAGEYAPLAANPYRGCGHKCAYCLDPETPVQMADGTARAIGALNIGDELIGIEKRDEVRRAWNYKFVRSTVLNKITTINKPVYRITLENGASVTCSGEHRWLTERGWKFASMLTLNNQVRTFSGPTTSTAAPSDLFRQGYIAGIVQGDGTLKRYDYSGQYTRTGKTAAQKTDVQHHFRLALADTQALDRTADYLAEFGIHTHRVQFAEAVGARRPIEAIRNHSAHAYQVLTELMVARDDQEWLRGWLSGIFDAEGGTTSGCVRIYNTAEEILGLTDKALAAFGFRTVRDVAKANGCSSVRILGGLPEVARFFNLTGPAISRKFPAIDQRLRGSSKVADVQIIRERMELVDITTSTENFVANGMISHNCYVPAAIHMPRPEFDAGATDKPRWIERLTRDAVRYRAAGVTAQVMLSFSTDPYHPGDTTLTRRTLEILRDHGLAFCTLTKGGTLALQDIELFRPYRDAFAATLTTLDDRFSQKWERAAALPGDRIKALELFNRAGVFTWVSLEPTLDVEASLAIVQRTHRFVDLYKIGRANYLKAITRTTDWRDYTLRMADVCQRLGVKHYIKKDLQPYLPAGYDNPLRVEQHH